MWQWVAVQPVERPVWRGGLIDACKGRRNDVQLSAEKACCPETGHCRAAVGVAWRLSRKQVWRENLYGLLGFLP